MIFIRKKGFTFIEVMIVVVVIIILSTISFILMSSSQKRTAINAYKSSMKSVQTAAELCFLNSGSSVVAGNPGDFLCNPNTESRYPEITSKCGSAPYFRVSGGINNWVITTTKSQADSSPWDCKGCRLICSTESCDEAVLDTCK